MFVIGLNFIALTQYHWLASEDLVASLETVNMVFVAIYFVEFVLKLAGHGKEVGVCVPTGQ